MSDGQTERARRSREGLSNLRAVGVLAMIWGAAVIAVWIMWFLVGTALVRGMLFVSEATMEGAERGLTAWVVYRPRLTGPIALAFSVTLVAVGVGVWQGRRRALALLRIAVVAFGLSLVVRTGFTLSNTLHGHVEDFGGVGPVVGAAVGQTVAYLGMTWFFLWVLRHPGLTDHLID